VLCPKKKKIGFSPGRLRGEGGHKHRRFFFPWLEEKGGGGPQSLLQRARVGATEVEKREGGTPFFFSAKGKKKKSCHRVNDPETSRFPAKPKKRGGDWNRGDNNSHKKERKKKRGPPSPPAIQSPSAGHNCLKADTQEKKREPGGQRGAYLHITGRRKNGKEKRKKQQRRKIYRSPGRPAE